MPPLPDVPNVLKIVHTGTIAGEPWAGVSHWRFVTTSGPLTGSNIDAICAKFVNSWRDNIRPWTAVQCIDAQVEGVDLTSVTSAIGTALDGDAGADSGGMISPESCMLVRKTVARRYRGGHARTYWPGTAGDFVAGRLGRLLDFASHPTFAADFVTYYSDIPPAVTTDSDCNASSFHEVQVSYHHAGALRTVPLVDDIVGYTLEQALATQRRRQHRS